MYPSKEQPTCKSIQNLSLPDFLKCAAPWTHWVLLVIWASTVTTESLMNIELWKLPPWKLTYPLKIDGWKMKRPFKWSLFRGHSFIFGVLYVFVLFLISQHKDPINQAGHASCHFWSLKTGEKQKVQVVSSHPLTPRGESKPHRLLRYASQVSINGPAEISRRRPDRITLEAWELQRFSRRILPFGVLHRLVKIWWPRLI